MTIIEYALLRAARQKMTPAELELANHIVGMADRGEPEAKELLRKMVHDVLQIRHTPMPHKAVE